MQNNSQTSTPLLRLEEGANGRRLTVISSPIPTIASELKFVAAFGDKRTAKSFLLSSIIGKEGVFTSLSGQVVPMTKGADLYIQKNGTWLFRTSTNIAWIDMEGCGDRGDDYDAHLAIPVLLVSSVIIYNYKGALKPADILEKLGVLVTLCRTVAPDVAQCGQFGALYFVYRDADDVEAEDVLNCLFEQDATPHFTNIRQTLRSFFSEIRVFCLPPASDNIREMRREGFSLSNCSHEFKDAVRNLRTNIDERLSVPRKIRNTTVTGPVANGVIREFADLLNRGTTVFPGNLTDNLERNIISADVEATITQVRDVVRGYGLIENPQEFRDQLMEEVDVVLRSFNDRMDCYQETLVEPCRRRLERAILDAIENRLAANITNIENALQEAYNIATQQILTTFVSHWNAELQRVPFNIGLDVGAVDISFTRSMNETQNRFTDFVERQRMSMEWPLVADCYGRVRMFATKHKTKLVNTLVKKRHIGIMAATAAAATEMERDRLRDLRARAADESRARIDNQLRVRYDSTQLGEIATSTVGNYMKALRMRHSIDFLVAIPRCHNPASGGNPFTDNELIEDLLAAIECHPGMFVPANSVRRGRRERSTKFLSEREVALRSLRDAGYLDTAYPNPGHAPGGDAEWPLEGYNNRRLLPIVYNVIRMNQDKEELLRILIQNIYYGLTGNGGGAWCGNGQGSFIMSTLFGFLPMGNHEVDQFDNNEFSNRVLHAAHPTKEAQIKAAEKYLDEVGIFGSVRDGYIAGVREIELNDYRRE